MVQLQTYILLLLPLVVVGQTNKTDNHRAEKALSVFTVVKVRGQGSRVGQLLLGASVLAHPMTPYSLNWGVEERSDERE